MAAGPGGGTHGSACRQDRLGEVTGAGSGIGAAAAAALAREGAILVLTGRRRAPLQEVADKIAAGDGTAHVREGDLMQARTAESIGAFIKEHLGRLDILVNNA